VIDQGDLSVTEGFHQIVLDLRAFGRSMFEHVALATALFVSCLLDAQLCVWESF